MVVASSHLYLDSVLASLHFETTLASHLHHAEPVTIVVRLNQEKADSGERWQVVGSFEWPQE